jgi:hypothetical protein
LVLKGSTGIEARGLTFSENGNGTRLIQHIVGKEAYCDNFFAKPSPSVVESKPESWRKLSNNVRHIRERGFLVSAKLQKGKPRTAGLCASVGAGAFAIQNGKLLPKGEISKGRLSSILG